MDVIKVINYQDYTKEIELIRTEVFVQEMKIREEEEFDEKDKICCHVLIFKTKEEENLKIPVATGRVLRDGHVGRIAVRKGNRKQGIGTKVIKALEELAVEHFKCKKTFLYAVKEAIPFYERLGYCVSGESFVVLSIKLRHYPMTKTLSEH